MKKIILIIALLFLAGCAGVKQYSPNFHTGIKGLTLEFLDNAPPDELLFIEDNQQFLVGIGLRNEGAEDIKKGKINIISFKSHFKFIKGEGCDISAINLAECNIPKLQGKGFSFAEGEFYPLYLDAELNINAIKKEGEGLKEIIDNIIVEAEYEYATTASIDICVNDVKEIFELKKSCTAKTEALSGQGAPVAVTQVEYTTTKLRDEEGKPGKNRIRFIITFEDKGDREEGIIQDQINLDEISFSDYSYTAENKDKQIKCTGIKDNKVKIKKSGIGEYENKIICEADIDRVPAYITPLIIKFSYRYYTEEKKIIRIKKEIEE